MKIQRRKPVKASVLYELLDDEYEHIGGWYDDEQEARFAALNICEDNPQIQFLSIRRYNDADDDGEIIDEIESEYYIEESIRRTYAITCTGDDYKVKMLRQFLEKMNPNTDTWDYVQVKCNGKAINLDEGAVNLLIDYYTNVYDPKKDAYSSEYVGASNRPAPRKRAIKATNEVYRNTNPMAFSEFIGKVDDGVSAFTKGGAYDDYDVTGSRFVDDDIVVYELMLHRLYDRRNEITYITVIQDVDGFTAYLESDEDTVFATGKTFDAILQPCVDKFADIIYDYDYNYSSDND